MYDVDEGLGVVSTEAVDPVDSIWTREDHLDRITNFAGSKPALLDQRLMS